MAAARVIEDAHEPGAQATGLRMAEATSHRWRSGFVFILFRPGSVFHHSMTLLALSIRTLQMLWPRIVR